VSRVRFLAPTVLLHFAWQWVIFAWHCFCRGDAWRAYYSLFSARSEEEVAWRLCAPSRFQFFRRRAGSMASERGELRRWLNKTRVESSEGDRRAATTRMGIEENWLPRGPVLSSMRGACIEGAGALASRLASLGPERRSLQSCV